jgi:hypothetical protein
MLATSTYRGLKDQRLNRALGGQPNRDASTQRMPPYHGPIRRNPSSREHVGGIRV